MDPTFRCGLPEPMRAMPLQPASGGARLALVAEEVAVALTCDGMTCAVMMATPAALEDFALGFCLTEGIIREPRELLGLEVLAHPEGIELRLDLSLACRDALWRRQRRLAGPLGCGLCGVQSLQEAMRPVMAVRSGLRLLPSSVAQAVAALSRGQALHRQTHSMHAAGFWCPARELLAIREDVGRHNALDKLAGALARQGIDACTGAVVLTSRVSVELIQKAAVLGAPVLIAVSAPTALAIRSAEACGITLIARARGASFDVFTHSARIAISEAAPERLAQGQAQPAPTCLSSPSIAAAASSQKRLPLMPQGKRS